MPSRRITLPCGHEIDEAEILSLAGKISSGRVKERRGWPPGKPRSRAKRCPCGRLTLKMALIRGCQCIRKLRDGGVYSGDGRGPSELE